MLSEMSNSNPNMNEEDRFRPSDINICHSFLRIGCWGAVVGGKELSPKVEGVSYLLGYL